jgi:hypothetical protein
MSLSLVLRRAIMLTAVALALTAPAALAQPTDRSDTSSLAGTTAEQAIKQDLAHLRAGNSIPMLDAARAQERYYASYGTAAPLTKPAAAVADPGDGVAGLPFALSVFGALIVGLGAGSGLHLVRSRRRHSAGLAI